MRRTGFAQAHRGIIGPRLHLLTGNQTKVLLAVLMAANPKTGLCVQTNSEIAQESGVPRTKVGGCLKVLAGMGLVTYEPGVNEHKRTVVNVAPTVGDAPIVPTFEHLCGCDGTEQAGCHDTEQAEAAAGDDAGQPTHAEGNKRGNKRDGSEQPIVAPKGLELKPLNEGLETGTSVGDPDGPADVPQECPTCRGSGTLTHSGQTITCDDCGRSGVLT